MVGAGRLRHWKVPQVKGSVVLRISFQYSRQNHVASSLAEHTSSELV